jgi:polyisoprenyl-teichoic acid--peptidoglycan teichoic acid transferase
MPEKLRVPPPPPGRAKPKRPSKVGGRSRGKSKRSAGSKRVLLSAVGLVLGLLVVCLVAAAVPALFLAREGGRVNLLLVGVDRRSGTGWTYRTDTIMVVTMDPATRAAGVLSIPRDLQVPIPGHGPDRINTANVYGYRQDYPGGGPGLLKATIAASFRIPIDGYLMVDFDTFVRIVDAVGGIEVDVPKVLHDTRYPDPRPGDPHAFKTIHFDAGLQHMDGERALQYARSRMSTSDFDRAERQQQILVALRERTLQPGVIPRWPLLVQTVMSGIKTDLGPGKLLVLALAAIQVDASRMEHLVLEPPMVSGQRRADGAAVQVPNWGLINSRLDAMFGPRIPPLQ